MQNTGQADLGNRDQILLKAPLIPGDFAIHQQIGAKMSAKFLETIGNGKTRTEFGHSGTQLCLGYPPQQDAHSGRCQTAVGDGLSHPERYLQCPGADTAAIFSRTFVKNHQTAVSGGRFDFQRK